MKLKFIAENLGYQLIGEDKDVNNITCEIGEVTDGSLYFVLNEKNISHILKAIRKGAAGIVWSGKEKFNISKISVDDDRLAFSKISALFFGYSPEKIKVIGVIGTNGKTTVCNMLADVLRASGKKIGTICTQKIRIDNTEYETNMTTPDPPELFKAISMMIENGCEYAVMEVTAHAIFFKKTDAIKFDYLVYTNCTQDHLDFFKTFDKYKETKKSYFLSDRAKKYIVNSDDEVGREILQNTNAISYGLYNPAEVFAINLELTENSRFVVNAFDEIASVQLNKVGIFNVYNFLSVLALARDLKIDMNLIVESAKTMSVVKGRCEYVGEYNGGKIYIDYAHTPDGLSRMLSAFDEICSGRLICLFGCGGNRDKDKRKKMGEIAGKLADFTVITSDNPRYEEPYEIIRAIESGIRNISLKYITIQDRKTAIRYAVDKLRKDDILVVAGKGDENYQEIMGVKHDYSDRQEIACILNPNGEHD